ncbi:uncharacterized protein CLBA1 [Hemicordylus capensis]|uniref:uncharacterized protein CLBA1 n=1 Tax=Hemicordylus capensis TaxID=884348 RepID=UPI002303DB5C|nr:uncharacterized protein CLBA1 [Hemicordylus capensis]XP_053138819.1 uncharacterized protein CLBA1 [Hemicordylus capensis]XP_053138820.1 uncharacterized protein CLBA1 [Hemicordylus capensis]XP_053138821.1 uncharacterized protein CLBA1 [Hemicordylus capensis]XP_053138823.1 uncharacterized protein CLBA1 [Hemicordylus capensis]XP_053138824.1 uncharacterized protein CLBA1 [Hemicordylus capensis]
MIPHSCNRKMQDENLAETLWGAEVSNRSLSDPLLVETSAISFSGNSQAVDVHHLNQNTNLNKSSELEVVWKSLPSEGEDGTIHEAPPDSSDSSMVESCSTWGEFEGFSEVKLENLSHTAESLEKLNEKQASTHDTDLNGSHSITSCKQLFSKSTGHNRREAFANAPVKASLSSEDIIKLCFPDVPVPQFLENISSLDRMLDPQTEDTDIPECTRKQLCTDSRNFWEILTHASNPSGLRCPWNGSHYQENLLAVLGIDAHQKALPEGKDDILKKPDVKENEDSDVGRLNISTCKALIQTKLSVSPDPKQSHLFTYNLFLKKTPSGGNMQYITVPQKKRIFTTQSLKMKIFSSNVC